MNKKRILGTLFGLVVVWGVCWALGLLDGTDPAVANLENERDAAFEQSQDLSVEQRREQFDNFRQKVESLTPEQQKQFRENTQAVMQRMMMQRMNEFLAKSPEEQKKALDKIIDAMESGGGPRFGGPPANQTADQISARMKGMLDRTSPEMRSKFSQFRNLMNERRKERGLPPLGP